MRSSVLLLTALALAGCFSSDSAGTGPQSASRELASDLAGPWAEVGGLNGDSLRLDFTVADTIVTAAGNFASAQGFGQLTGSGAVRWLAALSAPNGLVVPAHAGLVLALEYSDGRSAHLDQTRLAADTLHAVLSLVSAPSAISYGIDLVRAP